MSPGFRPPSIRAGPTPWRSQRSQLKPGALHKTNTFIHINSKAYKSQYQALSCIKNNHPDCLPSLSLTYYFGLDFLIPKVRLLYPPIVVFLSTYRLFLSATSGLVFSCCPGTSYCLGKNSLFWLLGLQMLSPLIKALPSACHGHPSLCIRVYSEKQRGNALNREKIEYLLDRPDKCGRSHGRWRFLTYSSWARQGDVAVKCLPCYPFSPTSWDSSLVISMCVFASITETPRESVTCLFHF